MRSELDIDGREFSMIRGTSMSLLAAPEDYQWSHCEIGEEDGDGKVCSRLNNLWLRNSDGVVNLLGKFSSNEKFFWRVSWRNTTYEGISNSLREMQKDIQRKLVISWHPNMRIEWSD